MRRHRTDLVSLFFGLFFAAVAGWWAISTYLDLSLDWDVPNLGWIAAAALILIGLLGVVASLRGDRREPVGPAEPAAPTPVDDTASFAPVVDVPPTDQATDPATGPAPAEGAPTTIPDPPTDPAEHRP